MRNAPTKTREIPRWAAVLIVAVAVAAAAWGIWAYFAGQANTAELVEVRPERGARRWMQGARPQADGVSQRPNGAYQIKAGETQLAATKGKTDKDWTYRFTYVKADLVPADQAAALAARYRLASDPAFAKSLNVSDDQLKQLKQAPAGTGMQVSKEDRQRIAVLWEAYLAAAAPKAAAEQALLKALREVGAASLEPTRAAIADRAKKVQSILTPEQIAPFKQ